MGDTIFSTLHRWVPQPVLPVRSRLREADATGWPDRRLLLACVLHGAPHPPTQLAERSGPTSTWHLDPSSVVVRQCSPELECRTLLWLQREDRGRPEELGFTCFPARSVRRGHLRSPSVPPTRGRLFSPPRPLLEQRGTPSPPRPQSHQTSKGSKIRAYLSPKRPVHTVPSGGHRWTLNQKLESDPQYSVQL